jgi:hypothetical protein
MQQILYINVANLNWCSSLKIFCFIKHFACQKFVILFSEIHRRLLLTIVGHDVEICFVFFFFCKNWSISLDWNLIKLTLDIAQQRPWFRIFRTNWAQLCLYLVSIYVAGLLVVVGGVVNDETDRVWSEALFALTCCSSNQ